MTKSAAILNKLTAFLSTILLTIGEQRGMLLPELAKVLGTDDSNLRHLVKTHSLPFVNMVHETTKQLRAQGIIQLTGRAPNFLPRKTVEALIKIVTTEETWAIYDQLWDVARAVRSYGKKLLHTYPIFLVALRVV